MRSVCNLLYNFIMRTMLFNSSNCLLKEWEEKKKNKIRYVWLIGNSSFVSYIFSSLSNCMSISHTHFAMQFDWPLNDFEHLIMNMLQYNEPYLFLPMPEDLWNFPDICVFLPLPPRYHRNACDSWFSNNEDIYSDRQLEFHNASDHLYIGTAIGPTSLWKQLCAEYAYNVILE